MKKKAYGAGKVYIGDSEIPVGECDGVEIKGKNLMLKNLRLYPLPTGTAENDPDGKYGGGA